MLCQEEFMLGLVVRGIMVSHTNVSVHPGDSEM